MERIYRRLKGELEETHRQCEVLRLGGEDYSKEWAYAGGLFLAIRLLHQQLGYQ